jgi:hypothetical protein
MTQVSVIAHALLQRPQCDALDKRLASHPSVRTPLQSSKPGWQAAMTHALAAQAWNACGNIAQAWLQPLQCAGSFRGSTQNAPPLHDTRGAAQPPWHWPLTHAAPAGHGWLQPPQCSGSREVATHAPPQGS